MGDTLRDLEHESRRKTLDNFEAIANAKKQADERRTMTKTQENHRSERTYWCGIDPGFSGAIAIIDDHQRIVECHDMPLHGIKGREEIACDEVIAILQNYQLSHIAIEKAQAMPGNGCVSMFKYGDGYGQIKGICIALELKHTLVHPATWKKRMMAGMGKDKGASIVRAKQLFGLHSTRKKDHGKADAILIAEYGRLLVTGKDG